MRCDAISLAPVEVVEDPFFSHLGFLRCVWGRGKHTHTVVMREWHCMRLVDKKCSRMEVLVKIKDTIVEISRGDCSTIVVEGTTSVSPVS